MAPQILQRFVKKSNSRATDQYYTKPDIADYCLQVLISDLDLAKARYWVEPSSGTGSFVDAVKKVSKRKVYAIDIDPNVDAEHCDFLEWDWSDKFTKQGLVVTVGNPPFGKNSSLAVKFVNRAAEFSDYIAFILPLTFSKPSIINRLHPYFHQVHYEKLPKNAFTFDGQDKNVTCGWYIYEKRQDKRPKIEIGSMETDLVKFIPAGDSDLDDVTLLVQRVGAKAGAVYRDQEYIAGKMSSRNYYRINLNESLLTKKQRKLLDTLDLSNADSKSDTAGMPSLSKPDVVKMIHEHFGVLI